MTVAANTAPKHAGDMALPVLRPDLEILPGPTARDGSPTFTLYDPLNRTFHKLGWPEAIILNLLRRPLTMLGLLGRLHRETTLRLAAEDVVGMCQQAMALGLTRDAEIRPVERLMAEHAARKMNPLTWLAHHYIFFRVPLLRPAEFLVRTLPYVRFLAHPLMLRLYFCLSLLGLLMVAPRHEAYLQTFSYFYNLQGLMYYGVVLIAVKVAHEFSHAYVATRFGARVSVMGLAFIVLWPLAYSDVTDAWRLKDRRQRLLIALAGIAAELIIAGLSLLGWALTAPGPLNSMFFVLSSSTLVATLAINLNPAMRWDGYYLLMDLWGVDNLHSRAFDATLWFLRKWLLGVDAPCPESALTPRRLTGFVLLSLYAWLYRFFLFLGIAVFVYHSTTKALGVLLFAVEVGWFIVLPVWREARRTHATFRGLSLNPRLLATLGVAGGLLLWAGLPLPRGLDLPAVVMASQSQVIYAPFSGQIQYLGAQRQARVGRGQPLVRIGSLELDTDLKALASEARVLASQREMLSVGGGDRSLLPQKDEELAAVEAKLLKLRHQMAQNEVVATMDGDVYEWDDTMFVGRYVSKDTVLGRVGSGEAKVIYAFIGEDQVEDIKAGQEGTFRGSDDSSEALVVIEKINPVREEAINDPVLTLMAQRDLAAVSGGQGGPLVLHDAYYLLVATVTAGDPAGLRLGQSGELRLFSRPRSLLAQVLRRAYRLVIQESNS